MIIGVDWSLNSASVCFVKGNDVKYFTIVAKENKSVRKISQFQECEVIVLPKGDNNILHADEMSKILIRKIKEVAYEWSDDDLEIVFENYAYSAKGNSLIDIVENTTIIRYELMKTFGVDIKVLSPTSVKKRFTGNGRSNKNDMLNTFKGLKLNTQFYYYASNFSKNEKPMEDMIDSYAVVDSYIKIKKENEEI